MAKIVVDRDDLEIGQVPSLQMQIPDENEDISHLYSEANTITETSSSGNVDPNGNGEVADHVHATIEPDEHGEIEPNLDHGHIKTISGLFVTGHVGLLAFVDSLSARAVSSEERRAMSSLSVLVSTGTIVPLVVIFTRGFCRRRALCNALPNNLRWVVKRIAIIAWLMMVSVGFWFSCNRLLKLDRH